MKRVSQPIAWRITTTVSFMVAALIIGAPDLAAQSPSEVRGIGDFNGTWVRDSRSAQPSCEGVGDQRNLPRNGCRFPVAELGVNARARAWWDFFDEPLEGKFYCVPESMPSMLTRNDPMRIDQRADRLVIDHEVFLSKNVTRIVWTDGRGFPPPGDVAYYGHSVGRYEGDELVIETRNFTFDPNGIDYQGQVPSSWAKHITERYSHLGPDRLQMVLTFEDPVFLTRPYTETFEFRRTDDSIEWIDCDPEAAGVPLRMLPPKYVD